jgi:hypothetical protein
MIEGTSKIELKNDVCHSVIVLKVLFHKWFPIQGVKPQKKKKHTKQPQEDRRRKQTLRERFIKNNRPLNLDIFLPKRKNNHKQGQP